MVADAGPPAADIEAVAAQVFIALADPTWRGILAALATGGPATATDLAIRLPITRQAIAKHLALLADAGLVTAEPGERRGVVTGCTLRRCKSRSSSWPRWPATGTARSTRSRSTWTKRRDARHEDSPDRHAAGMGGGREQLLVKEKELTRAGTRWPPSAGGCRGSR